MGWGRGGGLLVVAEDLGGGGGGHGCQEQRVAQSVHRDLRLERSPVPARGRCDPPHVVLQDALRRGAPAVGVAREGLAWVLGTGVTGLGFGVWEFDAGWG